MVALFVVFRTFFCKRSTSRSLKLSSHVTIVTLLNAICNVLFSHTDCEMASLKIIVKKMRRFQKWLQDFHEQM